MFEPSQQLHFPFSFPCNGWAPAVERGEIFRFSNFLFILGIC